MEMDAASAGPCLRPSSDEDTTVSKPLLAGSQSCTTTDAESGEEQQQQQAAKVSPRASRLSNPASLMELDATAGDIHGISARPLEPLSKAQLYSMKRCMHIVWVDLNKLENFRLVNTTAFIKILKKFDKVHSSNRKVYEKSHTQSEMHLPKAYDEAMEKISSLNICSMDSLREQQLRLERIYAHYFCKGDLLEAHQKLQLGFKGSRSDNLKGAIHFKSGLLVCLILWFFFNIALRNSYQRVVWNDPSIYVFAFVGNICAYRWVWAFNLQVWDKARVNYILLLSMADKETKNHSAIIDDAIDLSIGYLACFILYLDSLREPAALLFGVFPAYTFLIFLLFFTFFRVGHHFFLSTDFTGLFTKRVLYSLLTPWNGSTLVDRFAGDVLCSLSRQCSLLVYVSCFLFSGQVFSDTRWSDGVSLADETHSCSSQSLEIASAFMTFLPFAIRLVQTLKRQYDTHSRTVFVWPHAVNSLKYTGSILVIMLGTFHKINEHTSRAYFSYFVVLCVSITLFQSWFDVVVDWGLGTVTPAPGTALRGLLSGDQRLPPNVFLRPNLMFSSRWFYYIVLFVNPILRALWTLSLLPSTSEIGSYVVKFSPFFCAVELFRRFLWSCLKMEWDHISHSERWYESQRKTDRLESDSPPGSPPALSMYISIPFHFGLVGHASGSKKGSHSAGPPIKYIVALSVLAACCVIVAFLVAEALELV